MMTKILLLSLTLSWSLLGIGQDNSEDALILNQELQFLEEAAKGITISAATPVSPLAQAEEINDSESLENLYFGRGSADSIKTKTAAPARRTRHRVD